MAGTIHHSTLLKYDDNDYDGSEKKSNSMAQSIGKSKSDESPSLFDIAWAKFDTLQSGHIDSSQILELTYYLESLLQLPSNTSLLTDDILQAFNQFISNAQNLTVTKQDFILIFDEIVDSKIIDLTNHQIFGDFNDEYTYYNDNLNNIIKKELPAESESSSELELKIKMRNSLIEEIESEQDHLITLIQNSPIKLQNGEYNLPQKADFISNDILLDEIDTDDELYDSSSKNDSKPRHIDDMEENELEPYFDTPNNNSCTKKCSNTMSKDCPKTPPRSFLKLNTSSTTSLKQDLDELEYTHNLITDNFEKLEKNLINLKSQNLKDLSNLNHLFNKYYQNDSEISILQKQLNEINNELNVIKVKDVEQKSADIELVSDELSSARTQNQSLKEDFQKHDYDHNDTQIMEELNKTILELEIEMRNSSANKNEETSDSSISNSSSLSINLLSGSESNASTESLTNASKLLKAPIISRSDPNSQEEVSQMNATVKIIKKNLDSSPSVQRNLIRTKSQQRIILQIEENNDNSFVFYVVVALVCLFLAILKYYFP